MYQKQKHVQEKTLHVKLKIISCHWDTADLWGFCLIMSLLLEIFLHMSTVSLINRWRSETNSRCVLTFISRLHSANDTTFFSNLTRNIKSNENTITLKHTHTRPYSDVSDIIWLINKNRLFQLLKDLFLTSNSVCGISPVIFFFAKL